MTFDLATAVSLLALALTAWSWARTAPARLVSRVADLTNDVDACTRRTKAFEDESASRSAAWAKFLDEAEDLLEANERARRRAAASASRAARANPAEAAVQQPMDDADSWDPNYVQLRARAGL